MIILKRSRPLRVAVIGRSSCGKSAFIRSLLNSSVDDRDQQVHYHWNHTRHTHEQPNNQNGIDSNSNHAIGNGNENRMAKGNECLFDDVAAGVQRKQVQLRCSAVDFYEVNFVDATAETSAFFSTEAQSAPMDLVFYVQDPLVRQAVPFREVGHLRQLLELPAFSDPASSLVVVWTHGNSPTAPGITFEDMYQMKLSSCRAVLEQSVSSRFSACPYVAIDGKHAFLANRSAWRPQLIDACVSVVQDADARWGLVGLAMHVASVDT